MRVLITYPLLAIAAICALAGLADAGPIATPEPEPAGMCLGVQPICIGGGHACCRCEIGGINCVWACCR